MNIDPEFKFFDKQLKHSDAPKSNSNVLILLLLLLVVNSFESDISGEFHKVQDMLADVLRKTENRKL